ncbi:MAG: hypothetical protein FJ224_00865 [Lentisphaerae bacterium]|nr:hypothetical protein [Lentisphaerota bacterium]
MIGYRRDNGSAERARERILRMLAARRLVHFKEAAERLELDEATAGKVFDELVASREVVRLRPLGHRGSDLDFYRIDKGCSRWSWTKEEPADAPVDIREELRLSGGSMACLAD